MAKISEKRVNAIYEKNKDNYKIEQHTYSKEIRIELWRKNKKKGFYNFVKYLDNNDEETIKLEIVKDVLKVKDK